MSFLLIVVRLIFVVWFLVGLASLDSPEDQLPGGPLPGLIGFVIFHWMDTVWKLLERIAVAVEKQ